MGRGPCCEKAGLKKGPWTAEEDQKLTSYIRQHGHESWRALPKKAGLMRCGKSCRLRWTNYLRPDIKRGELTALEEQTILQLHALLGNRWSAIAAHLPKRTDNEIKNHWNTHLKKRLVNMGLDPATHKPATDILPWSVGSRLSESPNSSSSLAHTAQWESARLEAEARLAKESELRASGLWPAPASPQRSGPSTYCDQLSSNQCLIDIMALKQDMGRLVSLSSQEGHCNANSRVSTKALTSLDLANSFHNWEYSLQGQLGLMGPESWKLQRAATKGQQDSSSCSSAEETPSSTFRFFESPNTPTPVQGPSARTLILSWSDALHQAETRMEKPAQCSSSDTVGSVTSGKSDGCQAATNNICAEEFLSKNLASPGHNTVRVAEFCNAVARDSDVSNERELMCSSTSNPLDDVDQHPSPEQTSDVTRNCLIRLLSAHEDDLDYYWDDLLADSPKQVEEEKPFGNLFL